jgi:hypothetical protein
MIASNSKSHPKFMVVDESFHPVTRALGLNNNQALRNVGRCISTSHQHLQWRHNKLLRNIRYIHDLLRLKNLEMCTLYED